MPSLFGSRYQYQVNVKLTASEADELLMLRIMALDDDAEQEITAQVIIRRLIRQQYRQVMRKASPDQQEAWRRTMEAVKRTPPAATQAWPALPADDESFTRKDEQR